MEGSRRTNSCRIGAGGVLRDHNGDWLGGFVVNLGQGQVCDAAYGVYTLVYCLLLIGVLLIFILRWIPRPLLCC